MPSDETRPNMSRTSNIDLRGLCFMCFSIYLFFTFTGRFLSNTLYESYLKQIDKQSGTCSCVHPGSYDHCQGSRLTSQLARPVASDRFDSVAKTNFSLARHLNIHCHIKSSIMQYAPLILKKSPSKPRAHFPPRITRQNAEGS